MHPGTNMHLASCKVTDRDGHAVPPLIHCGALTEGEIADMDVDGPSSAPEVPASKKPRNAAAAPAAAAAPSVPDGLAVDGAGPSNPASAGPSTNSPPATGMDVDEAVPTPQAAELRASTQPQVPLVLEATCTLCPCIDIAHEAHASFRHEGTGTAVGS